MTELASAPGERASDSNGAAITPINHWIDGAPVAGTSGRTAKVFNPATGRQSGAVDLASVEEVDRGGAVREGSVRRRGAAVSLAKRAELMFAIRELVHARKEEIARILVAEHGKVLSDAMGEVTRGLEVIEFACGIPTLLKGEFSEQASTGVDVYSIRQPVGVVAGITPFNFPAMVPMWMWAPAIACGNTFVLKPSEKDPSASIFTAELLKEAGAPGRRLQRRPRRQGRRRCAARASRTSSRSVVRRLDPDRAVHLRDGHEARQARAGARRRQEPHDRAARRRHRDGRRRSGERRLRLGRRAVHGGVGRRRRRRRRRSAGRRDPGAAAEDHGRRRARSGVRDGAARHPRAPRQGRRLPRLRGGAGREDRRRRPRDARRRATASSSASR